MATFPADASFSNDHTVNQDTSTTTVNYTFNITNNSSQEVSYNIPVSPGYYDGLYQNSDNLTGTIMSGGTAMVSYSASCAGDGGCTEGTEITATTIQQGSYPVLTLASGQIINFRFWSGNDGRTIAQYINILPDNGFLITEDTSLENNATGNGVLITVGGNGGKQAPETNNICIGISDA